MHCSQKYPPFLIIIFADLTFRKFTDQIFCLIIFLFEISYIIPIWFVFPLQCTAPVIQEQTNQCTSQSFQPNSFSFPLVEKGKWEKYLTIFRSYLEKKCKKQTKKIWTKEEDSELLNLNSKGISWDEISQVIPQTNAKICKRRYQRISQSLVRWPKELDNLIKEMAQSSNLDWPKIHMILYSQGSSVYPRHSVKQLKQRYLLNLRPGIISQQWNVEEDLTLLTAIKEKGTHWRKLSQLFAGRTYLQLKNRYYGTLRPLERKVLRKLNSKMKQSKQEIKIN